MSKSWAWLIAFLSSVAYAQSVHVILPQQCVWNAGDNLSWKSSSLDESSWQPWPDWKPDFAQPHFWLRCHFDPAALRSGDQPAVQVSSYSAYEVFLNGERIGGVGNLDNGNASLDAIRSYPVPIRLLSSGSASIVLRVTNRVTLSNSGPFRLIVQHPLELKSGNARLLDALRARVIMERATRFIPTAVGFGIVGFLALVLLGLYFYDRSRYELLLLSISCVSLAILRINELTAAYMLDYSVSAGLVVLSLGNIGLTVTQVPFFYALARRRMSWAVLILLGATAAYIPTWMDAILAESQPVWMDPFNTNFVRPFSLLCHFLLSFVPFFVFRPWGTIPRRIRPLAVLCMMWGAADVVWFALQSTILPIPGLPNLFARWGLDLLAWRAVSTGCVLTALLVLLFREQRQITQERALLAGELHAASEIQQMLAPAKIDSFPSLRIEVAFRPMREVGGDFYICRILPDGRQRVLVGDVSGKGAAAAMAATLLLGAAAARDSDAPAELLTQLSRVLHQSNVGGFATCLCVDISKDGSVRLANAGHLAPYLDGEEISVNNGLPLGIAPIADYPESTIHLAPGRQLTFVSDGVVEAQSTTGELFGFDRTAAISTQSAEAIAKAAQAHGQEDDITVLTLTFTAKAAEVLYA